VRYSRGLFIALIAACGGRIAPDALVDDQVRSVDTVEAPPVTGPVLDASIPDRSAPGDATVSVDAAVKPPKDGGKDASSDAVGDSCDAGRTACGNACVDLMTDPNHCGACGTTCDAACVLGQCEATQIRSGLKEPAGLATDGTTLFVAERAGGAVRRLDFDGNLLDTWSDADGPGLVVVVSGYVYWLDSLYYHHIRVRRAALANPNAIEDVFANDQDDAYSFISNGATISLTTSSGSLYMIDAATGTTKFVLQRSAAIAAPASDAAHVFIVELGNPSGFPAILSVDLGTGQATELAKTVGGAWVFGGCIRSNTLFFGNIGDAMVRSVPTAGGAVSVVSQATAFWALECDANTLYLAETRSGENRPTIQEINFPNATPQYRSASFGRVVRNMLRAGPYLFWSLSIDGAVARMRVP
jgi:hypothetical protein